MRDATKILAVVLLLGWIACQLDTGTVPVKAPPNSQWRRTSRGWRELSSWYIPDRQFYHVSLDPITFSALECGFIAFTFLAFKPNRKQVQQPISADPRIPVAARGKALRPDAGRLSNAADRPIVSRPIVSRPIVSRPIASRLSAAVRPTASKRTLMRHSRVDASSRVSSIHRSRPR